MGRVRLGGKLARFETLVLAFAGVEGKVTILPRRAEGREVCLAVEWTSA